MPARRAASPAGGTPAPARPGRAGQRRGCRVRARASSGSRPRQGHCCSRWPRPVGLPATRLMAEVGAFAMRSDTELLLKSRRVTPGRLSDAGFTFGYPNWQAAAADLASRRRRG
ncbi:DUF1731 domain-containing protein [Micromonospora chokoriensis]|uniref:DUF1731 domain-containing protein n=1 Tax=Micromonospora chokoriensis TaxID=356851 RepID=UPI003B289A0A